jgi:hypothetical protein
MVVSSLKSFSEVYLVWPNLVIFENSSEKGDNASVGANSAQLLNFLMLVILSLNQALYIIESNPLSTIWVGNCICHKEVFSRIHQMVSIPCDFRALNPSVAFPVCCALCCGHNRPIGAFGTYSVF